MEVELNPDVFPESEIEWMQVDAIAGARKEMNWKGTDLFRQAIGLKPIEDYKYGSQIYLHDMYGTHTYGADVDNYVFNFVGTGDFDGKTIDGTKFPTSYEAFETGWANSWGLKQWPRVFGCGTDDYIIEPQMTCFENIRADGNVYIDGVPFLFPAVEINVTVQVKLKSLDLPIILSRIYLPDYQYLEISDQDEAKCAECYRPHPGEEEPQPEDEGSHSELRLPGSPHQQVLQVDFGLLQINREGQKGLCPRVRSPLFFLKTSKKWGISCITFYSS